MVDVDTVFDQTGNIDGKLHVGDFVNYSAGKWDGDNGTEYSKIANTGVAPNNATDLPAGDFQFGGFTSTASRDGNATPRISSYAYVTDKATGQAVTGWRVFDVTEEKITLISAGCPEDFYHPYRTNYAYISEFILTGNINDGVADASSLGLGTTYKPRDWSMYLSSAYKTTGTATVLTKAKLDAWYTKYMGVADANTYNTATFQTIYGTKYESLIDNYSYYWLSSACSSLTLNCVYPSGRAMSGYDSNGCGLRPLITLPSTTKVSEESVGTKTVTSRGTDYTYNVWNIE